MTLKAQIFVLKNSNNETKKEPMLFLYSFLFIQLNHAHLQVHHHTVINSSTTIDNVDLSNAECQSNERANGGAYFITSPAISVNLTNCSFTSCFNHLSTQYSGGSVYIHKIDNTFISDCTFVNCTSYYGGALGLTAVKSVNIDGCHFDQNRAEAQFIIETHGNGGAIFFNETSNCSLHVSNCIFDSNIGGYGAGIYIEPGLNELNVFGTQFLNNRNNEYRGSAIFAGSTTYEVKSIGSASIVQCTFNNNSIGGGAKYQGTAFFITAESFVLKQCNFSENHGLINNDCAVCSISLTTQTLESLTILIDSCNFDSNTGSLIDIVGNFIDEVKLVNCQFTKNAFCGSPVLRSGLDIGVTLPPILTFDGCIFTSNSNTYASTNANQLYIPKGTKRYNIIRNCIFNGEGVTQSGPSLSLNSYTEITNTSFIKHSQSSTTLTVSGSTLFLISIDFSFNDCAGNKNGFICKSGNITIHDITFSDFVSIKDAAYIIIENATLSSNGIEATAENIIISNSHFEADDLSPFQFNASGFLSVNNLRAANTQKPIEFNGLNSTSKIVVHNSSFESAALKVSNAHLFNVNHTTFTKCSNGALSILNDVTSAFVNLCTFTNCSSKSNGGAISSSPKVNFTVHATSFRNCQAAGKGSCIYLITGVYSLIYNCTFVHSGGNNPSSIFLDDKNADSMTVFINDCFSSVGETTKVKHLYSEAKGIIHFHYPLCFDSSREDSVYFEHKQEPEQGYDCYNCKDCGHMPVPGPSSTPTPTETPSIYPSTSEPTPSPEPTNVPDEDSSKKLKPGAIAGISIACFLVVVALVFLTIYFVRKKKNATLGLDTRPLQTRNDDELPEGPDRVLASVNPTED